MKYRERIFSLGLILCGVILTTSCNSAKSPPKHWEEARQSVLDGLHEGAGLSKDYLLRAVPALATPKGYELGSAFIADELPLRHSAACQFEDVNAPEQLGALPIFSEGRTFDTIAGIPDILTQVAGFKLQIDAALKHQKQITFAYAPGTGQTVDLQPLKDQLMTENCVADIANRDIWILAGIYNMKEIYTSKREFIAGIDLETIADLKVGVHFDDKGDFKVEDTDFRPRAWAFVPVRIDIEEFSASAPKGARKDMARAFLGSFEGPDLDKQAIKIPDLDVDEFMRRLNAGQVEELDR